MAWSARLHLRPIAGRSNSLEGSAGAYAWVLALAHDKAEYRELVAAEMEGLGLFVAEVEDLGRYRPHEDDQKYITDCAGRLSREGPVQYHDFHTYPCDDA